MQELSVTVCMALPLRLNETVRAAELKESERRDGLTIPRTQQEIKLHFEIAYSDSFTLKNRCTTHDREEERNKAAMKAPTMRCYQLGATDPPPKAWHPDMSAIKKKKQAADTDMTTHFYWVLGDDREVNFYMSLYIFFFFKPYILCLYNNTWNQSMSLVWICGAAYWVKYPTLFSPKSQSLRETHRLTYSWCWRRHTHTHTHTHIQDSFYCCNTVGR